MASQTAMGGSSDPGALTAARAAARAKALSSGQLSYNYSDGRGGGGIGMLGGLGNKVSRLDDDIFAKQQGQETYGDYLKRMGLKDPYDDSDSSSGGGSSGGSNSGSGSNVFGSGTNIDDAFLDKNIARAKDLATWNLGLSKQQMENAYGFRDKEANRDFGFQRTLQGDKYGAEQKLEDTRQFGDTSRLGMSLKSQEGIENVRQFGDTSRLGMQLKSQEGLENLRQTGVSTRQTEQLKNQRDMQESQFNNQRLTQAIQAARARSGFTKRGGF